MMTPWGHSQSIEEIAPGIVFVSCAGHGGFKLDDERNKQVPAAWRARSFNKQGLRGWYEEDCDAVLVVLSFPGAFPDQRERALRAFASMFHDMPAPVAA